jgi:Domain of unknown function (DUF4123)
MNTSKIDLDALRKQLTPSQPLRLFALVDAAGNQSALDFMYEQESLSFDCLFQGEVEPDVFEVAPFLVDLENQPEVLEWLLEGWGNSWVSFLHSESSLDELQIHLRQFTEVRTPDGEVVWFRFYDPSVMRASLPILTPEQCASMFKEVVTFLCEGEDPASLVRLSFDGSKSLVSTTPLA